MRGDPRRFRRVASRLLHETESAHFAPIALRFVQNVCFVKEARHFENSEFSKTSPFFRRVACTCGDFAGGEKREKSEKVKFAFLNVSAIKELNETPFLALGGLFLEAPFWP